MSIFSPPTAPSSTSLACGLPSGGVYETASKTFGVLIDMRGLGPGGLRPEAQSVMVEGQEMYRKAGMQRSCVILQSATVTMQFQRLARDSGIDSYERYINAAAHPDWQARAVAWIEKKEEPGR
jgi:hypothetical protein